MTKKIGTPGNASISFINPAGTEIFRCRTAWHTMTCDAAKIRSRSKLFVLKSSFTKKSTGAGGLSAVFPGSVRDSERTQLLRAFRLDNAENHQCMIAIVVEDVLHAALDVRRQV